MKDVNAEAEKTLAKLDCKVVYSFPEEFNTLPVVSFYNLTETGYFGSDNKEDIQESTLQVDVYSNKVSECGTIGLQICELMIGDGWVREMSADLPRQSINEPYHRTIRFSKLFI